MIPRVFTARGILLAYENVRIDAPLVVEIQDFYNIFSIFMKCLQFIHTFSKFMWYNIEK